MKQKNYLLLKKMNVFFIVAYQEKIIHMYRFVYKMQGCFHWRFKH